MSRYRMIPTPAQEADRWHVAFAAIPAPVTAPGNGQVVGIDRGVAARNIAAGHAVTARGGFRGAGPANREPQLLTSLVGRE